MARISGLGPMATGCLSTADGHFRRKTEMALSPSMPSAPRFPPAWTLEESNNARFIVRDTNGQALGYFYFEEEPADARRRRC